MANHEDDRKRTGARTRKGFQHAAATARKAVNQIAGKKGFAEADVLLNWSEIAGTALASACWPVKVVYGSERVLGATLVVQTTSARAPEIEMQGPTIVERVNQHYGYAAIRRLRITHTGDRPPAAGFAEENTPFLGPGSTQSAEPTEFDRAAASRLTDGVISPGLRDALTTMGANVMARDRVRSGAIATVKKRGSS